MNGQYWQTVGQWEEYQAWLDDPVAQVEYKKYLDEKRRILSGEINAVTLKLEKELEHGQHQRSEL